LWADGGVLRLELRGLREGGQRLLVPAKLHQAAREIGLGRDVARQELCGALQRLARLGEAAELEPHLAQQMEGLAHVGARLDDAGEHLLGRREIAGRRALKRVAAEGLDLLVVERHAAALAEPCRLAKKNGKEKAGGRKGGRERPPARVRSGMVPAQGRNGTPPDSNVRCARRACLPRTGRRSG
jgi:hypothetical protein